MATREGQGDRGGTSEQKCKGWIFLPVILVLMKP